MIAHATANGRTLFAEGDALAAERKAQLLEHRLSQLCEGETRLRRTCADGVIFETDYYPKHGGDRVFTTVWFNTDGMGFMDEARGDHIISIQW